MPRHVPQRSCIVCGVKREKAGLLRIVRRPDGHVEVDPSGRMPGRGAYLCESRPCWEAAINRGRLARALAAQLDVTVRSRLLSDIARVVPGPGPQAASAPREGEKRGAT